MLLYKDSYQPVILPTRYIVDERRETKQANTISREILVLRWFYDWSDVTEINLEDRLRSGRILTKAEMTGFCRYLRAKRNEAVAGYIGAQNQRRNVCVPVLSPETFNSCIGVVERFLLWAAYEFIPMATPEDAVRETLRVAVKRIKRAFRNNRKEGHAVVNRRGLTHEELEEVRQILKPGSEQNPFKQSVQFRNYLIFELMLATGIRRGEVLKLKLIHLPYGTKTTLSVVRAPDDKDDPRLNEPQVKTRMREIPLPARLAVDLWKYVRKYRKGGTSGSSYVFTSGRDGSPLSLGAINWIFSSVVKKHLSHLRGRLSPHTMRHTFNGMLVEMAQSLGWEENKIKDLQRYLNGWSDKSEMPTRYTRRLIEAQANEVAEKFQEMLSIF